MSDDGYKTTTKAHLGHRSWMLRTVMLYGAKKIITSNNMKITKSGSKESDKTPLLFRSVIYQ